MKINRQLLDQYANRIHNLVADIGEVSASADRKYGEDSKPARYLQGQ